MSGQRSLVRELVVISGAAAACRRVAEQSLVLHPGQRVLWISDHQPALGESRPAAKARQVLGQELDVLVFDCHAGLDPDALGASSGAVRGGGVILLLTPLLDAWPGMVDPAAQRFLSFPHTPADAAGRFIQRVARLLRDAYWMRQRPAVGSAVQPLPLQAVKPDPRRALTADQQQVVTSVMRVVTGHRRRPLVVAADRGRGKSTALGVAAARLLDAGHERILVTAPRRAAVDALFEQAESSLPGAAARLRFVAPDALIHTPEPADLLLVDEAAAIPGPLLERLLLRYARIVFATTLHGYEGHGRGFALRFRQVLDRHTPQWHELRLSTPVRWAPGDPVEHLVSEILLLDAEAAADERISPLPPSGCTHRPLPRDQLLADETLLRELFGLLVLAHYQTRPSDLRQLLDAPGLTVWVSRSQGHVVAAALVIEEGGLPSSLAEDIWAGKRRPHGHLAAQTLAVHTGLAEAPCRRFTRVMRIAVHPAVQGRGLGSALLQEIRAHSACAGQDLLAASFGAEPRLFDFWRHAGFQVVRLGVQRDAASGVHSALMLQPLNAAGETLCRMARARFLAGLPVWLGEPLRDLEPELALRLLADDEAALPGQVMAMRDELALFAAGGRDYAAVLPWLTALACVALSRSALAAGLDGRQRQALLQRVLQRHEWSAVASALGLSGRRQVLTLLRETVGILLQAIDHTPTTPDKP